MIRLLGTGFYCGAGLIASSQLPGELVMLRILRALQKTTSVVLSVAILSVPLLLAGCEKEEIVTERKVEVKDKVVSEKIVVE